MNENTDITKKKALTSHTYSRRIFYLEYKRSGIIQNRSASKPYSKYILISNISIDKDALLFEITKKIVLVSLHQGKIFCWGFMMLVHLRLL